MVRLEAFGYFFMDFWIFMVMALGLCVKWPSGHWTKKKVQVVKGVQILGIRCHCTLGEVLPPPKLKLKVSYTHNPN
jgi:hypothetical protein